MPSITAIAIRYMRASLNDGTPSVHAIHGSKLAGDYCCSGLMVDIATILAREGVHAAFSGIEGKKDLAGPAFTRSTEANFQEMKSDFGFVP